MSSPDEVTYGAAARLRVAMAALASVVSETAGDMVATYRDGRMRPGELAAYAESVVRDGRELLGFAVAFERRRGSSWEAIAGWLGLDSGHAAEDAYGGAVRRLDDMLTEWWLLGDDPDFAGAPEGAADTAGAAARLDRWVTDRTADHGALGDEGPGDHARLFPVSGSLEPLDTAERAAFTAAAEELIARRREQCGPDECSVRELELGLARRQVELYEHLLADELEGEGTGDSPADLGERLGEARARLAELEARRPRGRFPGDPGDISG